MGNETNKVRSPGSADPKSSAMYVMTYTAESGPGGAPLRAKYREAPVSKSTKRKSDGNRGNVGRAFRARSRMHGGGQVSLEEKARREKQSREHRARFDD